MLNIFYSEPDPDRWFKFDRFPRKIIRRLLRGKAKIGGQGMVAVNLIKGLDKIGIPYRLNDYSYIRKNPDELACIIGKPNVLFNRTWKNPIVFGPSIYSHSIEYPNILTAYPNIKKILVPGEWMRSMFQGHYGDQVVAWPVGTDVEEWNEYRVEKSIDFLIYDKIRWNRESFIESLINPITNLLKLKDYTFQFIRYGNYTPDDLKKTLKNSKAVIFLCEHETQGLAYQQILATNTPILAWDRKGYWQDPYYYPHKIEFEPVSSVPYWTGQCGEKFTAIDDFENSLDLFCQKLHHNCFFPRDYIVTNLSLELCAQKYVDIIKKVVNER